MVPIDPAGSGFQRIIPFDPSGDPVPLVFLQLSLIFYNQHSRHGFYHLSQLPHHVLPHANLRVMGLDHPIVQFIGNDHVFGLGHLGLIRVYQNLLVHELNHTDTEQFCVELYLASIT
jgi:hypothetical protein